MDGAMRWSSAGLVLVVAALVAATVHLLLSVAVPSRLDGSYEHVAVVPLLCGGIVGIAVALATVVRRCLDPARRRNVLHILARHARCIPTITMWAAVCATSIAVFCVGEGVEQIIGLGHVLPVSVHYDSLVILGLFVACSGIACTILRNLLHLFVATVAVVVEWLFSGCFDPGALYRSACEALNFVPPSRRIALKSATRRGPPVAPALV